MGAGKFQAGRTEIGDRVLDSFNMEAVQSWAVGACDKIIYTYMNAYTYVCFYTNVYTWCKTAFVNGLFGFA